MSTDTIHAETLESGITVLAEDEPTWDDGPFPVRGVALAEEMVPNSGKTEGNIDTYWSSEVVKSTAPKFDGAKIVDGSEHDPETVSEVLQPSPDTIVGEITKATYKAGVGVLYEGEIDDPEIAKRVDRGRVDVSPTLFRDIADDPDDDGVYPVTNVKAVRDLSVVATGASEDNSIEPAAQAATAMAAEVLSEAFGAETMQGIEVHTPEFSSTETSDWSEPALEDFDTDDLSEVDDHFVVSRTGFPPDNFGDLALPVVSPGGALNLNALRNAKARAGQVSGLSGDALSRAESAIDSLANENYEGADFGAETQGDDGLISQSTADADGGDGQPANQPDSDTMSDENLTDDEKALLEAADDPAEAVETLRDYQRHEEPTIREQDDVEALREDLDDAKQVFAEALADKTGMQAETLASLDWSALRGEFENDDGDLDAETLFQQPEGGTAEADGTEDTGLDDEGRERIQEIDKKLELLGSALPRSRKDELKAEACGLADVEDYSDVEAEVL